MTDHDDIAVTLPPELVALLPELSAGALRLYLAQAVRESSGQPVSVADLAFALRSSMRTINRAQAELQRLGIWPYGGRQSADALANRDLVGRSRASQGEREGTDRRYAEPRSAAASQALGGKLGLRPGAPRVPDAVDVPPSPPSRPAALPPKSYSTHGHGEVGTHGGGTEGGQRPIPFAPRTEADLLALDIARTFRDEVHLPAYRFFCGKYDLALVRRAFAETQATPQERIRRSRFALFQFLLRKHAYANRNRQEA
jgi:hypothetical protein